MARKKHSESGEIAAEEAAESPAEEKAEKKAGLEPAAKAGRRGLADGGIARAADVLHLKPSPGWEGPANNKRDHPMSASMRAALAPYKNL